MVMSRVEYFQGCRVQETPRDRVDLFFFWWGVTVSTLGPKEQGALRIFMSSPLLHLQSVFACLLPDVLVLISALSPLESLDLQ